MNLLYSSFSYLPSKAANSNHVMQMASSLSKEVESVTVVVPDHSNKINFLSLAEYYGVDNNFKIKYAWPIPVKGKLYFYALYVLLYVLFNNIDAVYTRTIQVAYLTSLFRIKTIYEAHVPVNELGKFDDFLFRKSLGNDQFLNLTVISNALKNHYLDKYGIQDKLITVMPDSSNDFGKKKISEIKDIIHIAYVGSLNEGRGIDLLFEIAKKMDDILIHIIGGDEVQVSKFKRLAKQLHVSNKVKFYGFVPPSSVKEHFNGKHILIAPYEKIVGVSGGKGMNTVKWMSPLKIFEYMSTSLPIITSDLPAIREILEDHKTALLRDPENVDEWIEAINLLRSDQDLRLMIGENAREYFLKFYTWDQRALNAIELFK